MKLKHNYTGASIMELRGKFGVGSSGFYSSNPWYKDYDFAKEKPPAGIYGIHLDEKAKDKSLDEQVKDLKKGFEVVHPAILCEALLTYYQKTGTKLLEDWWVGTSSQVGAGDVSCVGFWGGHGLNVDFWGGGPDDDVGMGASQNLSLKSENFEPVKSLSLESAIKLVKEGGYKVYKEM